MFPITVAPCRDARVGFSVSAAFGGVNAAIVFGPVRGGGEDDRPSSRREVAAIATARVATDDLPLARVFPGAPPTLGRADAYVRGGIAALAAVRNIAADVAPGVFGPDTAVVLASASNCHAADLRYHAGLVDGGPAQASRLHFSYTVPGAPAAEASILLGLRAPVLVYCADGACAEDEARRLVAEGVVPSAVALRIESPGSFADAEAILLAPP